MTLAGCDATGRGPAGQVHRDRTRVDRASARGSATLELVVLTPALLALLMLVIAAGRITGAKAHVEQAARDAGRAASLERTLPAAQAAAQSGAQASLRGDEISCQQLQVTVTGGFTVPVGEPASVHVALSCTAALADLALPGLPGTRTERASYDAAIDSYRGR